MRINVVRFRNSQDKASSVVLNLLGDTEDSQKKDSSNNLDVKGKAETRVLVASVDRR